MKKVFFIVCLAALALTGCNENKPANGLGLEQADSLQKIIAQKDNELDDMMGTLNEIQEGLRVISEAENRVSIAKDGEGANKNKQIKENIQFISSTMAQNRELIAKLQKQLRESSVKSDQLKKTIEGFIKQLDAKEQELNQLRVELDAKDIHISTLDEKIDNLNSHVSNLEKENTKNTETINAQDRQLNTAWYVFGTKNELKEQQIYVGGKVLQKNFNRNYFTKIDIRVDKEIKLYSKSAKLLTAHPAGSYTLQQDANKQYILRITNPQTFWSTSKYLVVLVK